MFRLQQLLQQLRRHHRPVQMTLFYLMMVILDYQSCLYELGVKKKSIHHLLHLLHLLQLRKRLMMFLNICHKSNFASSISLFAPTWPRSGNTWSCSSCRTPLSRRPSRPSTSPPSSTSCRSSRSPSSAGCRGQRRRTRPSCRGCGVCRGGGGRWTSCRITARTASPSSSSPCSFTWAASRSSSTA